MKTQIKNIVAKAWFGPTAAGASSLGAGVVCGWFIHKRFVAKQLEEATKGLFPNFVQLDLFDQPEEDDGTVVAFPLMATTSKQVGEDFVREMVADTETIEEVTEEVEEVLSEPSEPQESVEVGIFANQIDPNWDYEEELKRRSPSTPYVIHQDEFYGDEYGWDNQQTLTWYEGDKILSAEDDSVIYDVSGRVGELKFGHGSGDPDVVYIRDEKRHVEYEVCRLPGSYEFDVIGEQVEQQMVEDDLKHSNRPGKFRFD